MQNPHGYHFQYLTWTILIFVYGKVHAQNYHLASGSGLNFLSWPLSVGTVQKLLIIIMFNILLISVAFLLQTQAKSSAANADQQLLSGRQSK